MRDYLFGRITDVDPRFKNLDPLPGDASPPQTPDQLFTFARKHRPAHHLDPTGVSGKNIHIAL
jgi:hypothetical protein